MPRSPHPILETRLRRRFVLLGLVVFTMVMALILLGLNLSQCRFIEQKQEATLDLIVRNGGFFPEDATLSSPHDPEAAYRARYFSLYYGSTDGPLLIRTRRVVALDESDILQMAQKVLQSERHDGTMDGYRFQHRALTRGHLMVFLDIRQDTLTLQQMQSLSLLIFGLLFIIIAVLLYLFSGRAVRPVVRAVESQQRFITDASHELKTPLAILKANLEVSELLHGKDEWLQSSHDQIDRLNKRLDQLLSLSRIQETHGATPKQEVDLVPWAEQQLQGFRALFAHRAIEPSFSSPLPSRPWSGSLDTLSQVTSALLENAAAYTLEGTWFRLSLVQEGTSVVLHFENPSNLTDEAIPHLFERFYRADHARLRSGGGSGIGLSIVAALCEQEGWSIKARRTEAGTVDFALRLP